MKIKLLIVLLISVQASLGLYARAIGKSRPTDKNIVSGAHAAGPAITSISPASAGPGEIITITGTNFVNVTSITLGGTPVQSFTTESSTSIKVIAGAGASGDVVVNTLDGTAVFHGFIFGSSSLPVIISISPASAGSGETITITGTKFINVTSVSLGGMPVQSFTTESSTSIKVIVGSGASGDVVVNTLDGTAVFHGFHFGSGPVLPVINADGPLNVPAGGSVTLTVEPKGDSYQWLRDGANIPGETTDTYKATQTGSYTVTVTTAGVAQTSAPVPVTVQLGVPVNNFKISNTSVSCKGSANGAIVIEAVQAVSAVATINGPGVTAKQYAFTDKLTINNLASGNYNVCITLPADVSFQQCFNSNITEPKDLGVYAAVVNKTNQVVLSLSGAASYSVAINGATYTTTQSQLTLQLTNGVNNIAVSTDKPCQGIINKIITIADRAIPFPNPFTNIVNVNLGEDSVPSAAVVIYDAGNRTVYSRSYSNRSGVLQIAAGDLSSGLYFLKLTTGDKETIYKIIKK